MAGNPAASRVDSSPPMGAARSRPRRIGNADMGQLQRRPIRPGTEVDPTHPKERLQDLPLKDAAGDSIDFGHVGFAYGPVCDTVQAPTVFAGAPGSGPDAALQMPLASGVALAPRVSLPECVSRGAERDPARQQYHWNCWTQ